MQKQLIVVGGGAAGFFCAINAARMNPGLKVSILEKSGKVLSKVKVSGGGRCNVTHACFDIPALVKKYPRGQNFLKKAFYLFNPGDTIKWFLERGVTLKTEPDGRMFPASNASQTIIDCLLAEATKYHVQIFLQNEVTAIRYQDEHFAIDVSGKKEYKANFVCVACGGYPNTAMFNWLQQIGHQVEIPFPSLFTFNMPGNPIKELMGVIVEKATVKVMGSKLVETGPVLITHWGMSGPAILRLSAWGARELADKEYRFTLLVNWVPDYREPDLRQDWPSFRVEFAAQKISTRNPFGLPSRLWLYLLQTCQISLEIRWADLPAKEQNRLIQHLTAQSFTVAGKTTFKEEFVTCGGIKLGEIDPNTMQSKIQPGLYFAGEVMDVDGTTGGFNFQHAWTSGWIAAKSIAASL